MAAPTDLDLLGLSEVADLLGVSRQTAANWRSRRDDFPAPLADLRSGPIWARSSIVAWATGAGVEVAEEADAGTTGRPKGRGTTVALTNMKGGVGKSTLTVNLGWYGAYHLDLRVLLVDLDPQFNLSQYVLGAGGYEEHVKSGKKTVLDVFERSAPGGLSSEPGSTTPRPDQVVSHVRRWSDGGVLDLVPSSLHLSYTLKNPGNGKERQLSRFLDEIRDEYDVILIDCPPTDSMLTIAAYLASDSVLIPVKPEFLSTIGLPLVVSSLEEFSENFEETIDVLGVVFNASAAKLEDARSRSYVKTVAKEHGWTVFKHAVSQSDSYPKGSRLGTPIFLTDHARSWKIADFEAVANEFFEKLEVG
jgi:chromosome partitioning protein